MNASEVFRWIWILCFLVGIVQTVAKLYQWATAKRNRGYSRLIIATTVAVAVEQNRIALI